jgi:hypothetical protein
MSPAQIGTPRQREEIAAIAAGLRRLNPETADEFVLSRGGESVGRRVGETVYLLYSLAVGFDGVIDCRFPDGRCLTFPAAEF